MSYTTVRSIIKSYKIYGRTNKLLAYHAKLSLLSHRKYQLDSQSKYKAFRKKCFSIDSNGKHIMKLKKKKSNLQYRWVTSNDKNMQRTASVSDHSDSDQDETEVIQSVDGETRTQLSPILFGSRCPLSLINIIESDSWCLKNTKFLYKEDPQHINETTFT